MAVFLYLLQTCCAYNPVTSIFHHRQYLCVGIRCPLICNREIYCHEAGVISRIFYIHHCQIELRRQPGCRHITAKPAGEIRQSPEIKIQQFSANSKQSRIAGASYSLTLLIKTFEKSLLVHPVQSIFHFLNRIFRCPCFKKQQIQHYRYGNQCRRYKQCQLQADC